MVVCGGGVDWDTSLIWSSTLKVFTQVRVHPLVSPAELRLTHDRIQRLSRVSDDEDHQFEKIQTLNITSCCVFLNFTAAWMYRWSKCTLNVGVLDLSSGPIPSAKKKKRKNIEKKSTPLNVWKAFAGCRCQSQAECWTTFGIAHDWHR